MKINENSFSLKDKVFTMVWNAIMYIRVTVILFIIYLELLKIRIERKKENEINKD